MEIFLGGDCFTLWTGEILHSPGKIRGPAYIAVEGTSLANVQNENLKKKNIHTLGFWFSIIVYLQKFSNKKFA